MQDTKLRFRNIFMSVYIVAIVALLVLPMLKYNVKYILVILFTVPFVAVYMLKKRKSAIVFFGFLLTLVSFFIFNFLVNTPLNINASINMSILLYMCFIPFFIFDYLVNSDSVWEIRLVIIGTVAIFVFVMIMTSIAFIDDPTIARSLASGRTDDEYINSMRMQNVGGFGFSYAVGMFIPYIAIRIVRSSGNIRFVFIALYIALFMYALFCQYTTLLFVAIAFSTVIFIWGSKNALTKSILLFVSLLVLINLTGIFKFLGNHIPFTSLAYHLKNLYISMSTGEETNSRLLAAKRCIGLFRRNPFFGANLLDRYNSYIVNHGHSTYFGILASNGIAGLGILLFATVSIMRSIYVKTNPNKMNIIIFIMYIVLGFLNPTHNAFEISVVVFLLIPLIEFYENKIKEQKYAE